MKNHNQKAIWVIGFQPKSKREWIAEFALTLVGGAGAGFTVGVIIKFFAG